MASVVTGFGVAAYGFGAAFDFNVLTSPAQAQVNNAASNVPYPRHESTCAVHSTQNQSKETRRG
jgi:hypothetical protein